MKQMNITRIGEKVERTSDYATYLASIAVFKPLSIEDEVKLFEQVAKGDARAKESIINHNLRFVVAVAKKYHYTKGTLSMLDLIQYGNMGLMDAVDTFDVTRGFRFITHAVAYIRKAIMMGLNEDSRLVRDYHTTTTNEHTSLDTPVFDDNDTETLADRYCTTTDTESTDSLCTDVERVMCALLTDRERNVICNILGIGCTPVAKFIIAERMGMTEERVRQIYVDAISHIKADANAIVLLAKYIGQ